MAIQMILHTSEVCDLSTNLLRAQNSFQTQFSWKRCALGQKLPLKNQWYTAFQQGEEVDFAADQTLTVCFGLGKD